MCGVQIPEAFSPDEDFQSLINNHCKKTEVGSSRDVYEVEEPCCVVKVAKNDLNVISNWIEIAIYSWVSDNSSLAEIYSFSASGKYLVMEKLETPAAQEATNSFVWPPFVTDRKPDNIGVDKNGNCKILDYAFPKAVNAYKSEFI
jgi:hypothetical protein